MDRFEKAILRRIESPATEQPLDELELVFTSSKSGETCRFVVSGFDLNALPQLALAYYPHGLYMPMGIGVPPFFQSYEELQRQPPSGSRPTEATMPASCSTPPTTGSTTTVSASTAPSCAGTNTIQIFCTSSCSPTSGTH